MKIGAMYPQYEMGADPASIRRFALDVEESGFDYVSLPDHVVATSTKGREPPLPSLFDEHDKWQDPFTVFGFIAAITTTIGLHTGIFILPQRPTLLTARQAADVDLLSGGRLCLAVGLGWNYVEYDALGQSFRTRGRRMEEQIPLLRRLWSEELVSFAGEFDRLEGVSINPLPGRQIPIWMGGYSEPAYSRAARMAGGFVFGGDFEIVRAKAERMLFHLKAVGRTAHGFALEMMTASQNRGSRSGPQPSIDNLRRWRDWGGTHGSISSTEQGFASIDQHIEFQMRVKEAVLTDS